MLVHPVVIPGSGIRSWTVLGDDDVPVVPVDRFLSSSTSAGRQRGWQKGGILTEDSHSGRTSGHLFDYVDRQKNYKDDRKSAANLSLNRTRDGSLRIPQVDARHRPVTRQQPPQMLPARVPPPVRTRNPATLPHQDVLSGCVWDTKPALPHQEDVPFRKRNPPTSRLPGLRPITTGAAGRSRRSAPLPQIAMRLRQRRITGNSGWQPAAARLMIAKAFRLPKTFPLIRRELYVRRKVFGIKGVRRSRQNR